MNKRNKGADLPYTAVETDDSVIFGKKLTEEEELKDPINAWRTDGSSCITLDSETGWASIGPTTTRHSMKVRAKGFGAFDGDRLREEVRQLRDLVRVPKPLPQPQKRLDAVQILKRIESILREPNSSFAERLIDKFVRDLKAARRVAFSDRERIHPITKKPVATAAGRHAEFRAVVCRLTAQKKEPPTHGEVERELLRQQLEREELARELGEELNPKRAWNVENISAHVSKLCSQNRLSWLPDDLRTGRRRKQ